MFTKKNQNLSLPATVSLLVRIVMGPIFLVYGIGKLSRYVDTVDYLKAGFVESWLPMIVVTPLAYLIPIWETLIGISLLLGLKYRWGLIAMGVLIGALNFGLAVQGNAEVVSRNLLFLIIAIIGLRYSDDNQYSLDQYLKLEGKL